MNYRIFYFGLQNKMLHHELVSADNDDRAIAVAEELAQIARHDGTIEVWLLEKRVHLIQVGASPKDRSTN